MNSPEDNLNDNEQPHSLPDRAVGLLVRAYFTKTSLLMHVIFYPILMVSEGGDFHLFLDGISIEAVFIGLLVGISTKRILMHQHRVRALIRAAWGVGKPHLHGKSKDL